MLTYTNTDKSLLSGSRLPKCVLVVIDNDDLLGFLTSGTCYLHCDLECLVKFCS